MWFSSVGSCIYTSFIFTTIMLSACNINILIYSYCTKLSMIVNVKEVNMQDM